MKFSLITVIRNQQDVLSVFLHHIASLFDEIFIVDHRSIDCTSSLLKSAASQYPDWHYITLEANGFYQKESATILMHFAFARGADFVFFLDCDEFIQVSGRDELEQKVRLLVDPSQAGSFRWINGIPDRLDDRPLKYQTTLWLNPDPSQFSKVCIPRGLYEKHGGNISLEQGNHRVLDSLANAVTAIEVGLLIHLPIRSRQQLITKAILSSFSNSARTSRLPGESYQFDEMLKIIATGEICDDMVRGCIFLYQKETKIIPISIKELKRRKYIKTSLQAMHVAYNLDSSLPPPGKDSDSLAQLVSSQLLSWGIQDQGLLFFDEKEGRITMQAQQQ